MMKAWQGCCSVPIKSFYLELIANEFLPQCQWRLRGYFYYDWIVRDFFAHLCTKRNSVVWVPGTYESVFLGDAWFSRAQTAFDHAFKACEYEHIDWIEDAGREWQKIFGPQIPVNP